jgi:hypothetical protein
VKIPRVTSCKYLGGFRIRVSFSDGLEGEADLGHFFAGRKGLLGELQDENAFAKVGVNEEFGVLAWPNGVEFDPLLLWSEVTGRPIPIAASHDA